jgi:hypothetical protein
VAATLAWATRPRYADAKHLILEERPKEGGAKPLFSSCLPPTLLVHHREKTHLSRWPRFYENLSQSAVRGWWNSLSQVVNERRINVCVDCATISNVASTENMFPCLAIFRSKLR